MAFEAEDLEQAVHGQEVNIPPNGPSAGVIVSTAVVAEATASWNAELIPGTFGNFAREFSSLRRTSNVGKVWASPRILARWRQGGCAVE